MKRIIKINLGLLLLYGIAMGFMETIIVIYVREIYYPAGFTFPLVEISEKIFLAELLREACTIIMLLSIAGIAGKDFLQRFSYFLFSFAVWDIFYYIGLKWLINWPPSVFTWDILFLIPITWLGPVLAPLICSILMIILALLILTAQEKIAAFKMKVTEYLAMITGACLIFISFILDFAGIITSNHLLINISNLMESTKFQEILANYIPQHFNWGAFITGVTLILLTILLIVRRLVRNYQKEGLS